VIKIQSQLEEELTSIQTNIIENKLKLKQNLDKVNSVLIPLTKNYPESELFIVKFFHFLRMNQDLIYNILIHATSKEQRNILSSLVVEFMYENIFSSVSISNELLILIYRTLEYEINNLNDMNAPHLFLNENSSINKYLFKHLFTNTEIKIFMLKLLNKINELNQNKNNKELYFSPEKIKKISNLHSMRKHEKEQKISSTYCMPVTDLFINDNHNTPSSDKDKQTETDLTVVFKVFIGLSTQELQNIYNQQNDTNMKEYIMKQIQEIQNNELMFSSNDLLNQLYETKEAVVSLQIYYNNLNIIINYLTGFINEISMNINLIPNVIKKICKIVSFLIKKKFPQITKVNENAFIGRFLMEIFELILVEPNENGFLPSQIMSNSMKENMKLIKILLQQLFSGSFFKTEDNHNYTPFNCFFIQIMPQIFSLFEKLINTDLPKTLTNLINEKETNPQVFETFVFDYFKEYPNEQLNNILICFTPEQLNTLIELIKNNENILLSPKYEIQFQEEFLKYEKSFSKLKSGERYEEIKSLIHNDKKQKRLSYSFITEHIYNKKQTQSIIKAEHFALKEIKNLQTDENKIKNNIIKAKNALIEILYSTYLISLNDDFDPQINNTTFDFINSLENFIHYGYFNLEDSIKTEWYIKSIRTLLSKLPDEYKENDFNKLYEELKSNLELSINELDYKSMGQIKESFKYAKYKGKHIQDSIKDFEQINFMKKINDFIETFPIEVYVNKTKTNEGQNILAIESKEHNLTDIISYVNITIENETQQNRMNHLCHNIIQLIEKFPVIWNRNDKEKDLFDIAKLCRVPQALGDFFQRILVAIKQYDLSEFIEKDENADSNSSTPKNKGNSEKKKKKKKSSFLGHKEVIQITSLLPHELKFYIQISNYVMNRLYDKIFPKTASEEDELIYKKCHSLSWIELKHLTNIIKDDVETLLPNTIGYITCMDKMKNPREKIKQMDNVKEIVLKTLSFLFGSKFEGGMDAILPVMNYIIIKAMPKRFSSNIKYIETYYENIDNSKDQPMLVLLIAIKERLINFNYKCVLGISEEEFHK
jgi:hypothetical protein